MTRGFDFEKGTGAAGGPVFEGDRFPRRRISRRAFLRAAATGLGALTFAGPLGRAAGSLTPDAARAAEPSSMGKGNRRFLLLDDRNVSRLKDVELVLGRVEKHSANPFFTESEPWEQKYDNFYGNIVYDEEFGEYRLWYLCFVDGESSLLFARSRDGIHWEKPALGLWEYGGSKKNNIVLMGVHGAGVLRDDLDPDPSRRYKLIARNEETELLEVALSSDGIHWSKPIPQPKISATADTHNALLWAPTLGRYVVFTRQWSLWPYNDRTVTPTEEMLPPGYRLLPEDHPLRRKGVRQVARSETAPGGDFTAFQRAEVILEGRSIVEQIYAMPAFYYEGVYLGLPAVYEDFLSHRVWTELAWSLDTVEWRRLRPGEPFIPNGPQGAYDGGMVWGCASPIVTGEEIRVYYGGFDLPHGAKGRRGSLCLATLKRDRWAGYSARGEGAVLAAPLRVDGRELWANADASSGSLRAELLDEDGRAIEGFGANDALPIREDGTRLAVQWKARRLEELQGRRVRIRWLLDHATLYAYGVDGA